MGNPGPVTVCMPTVGLRSYLETVSMTYERVYFVHDFYNVYGDLIFKSNWTYKQIQCLQCFSILTCKSDGIHNGFEAWHAKLTISVSPNQINFVCSTSASVVAEQRCMFSSILVLTSVSSNAQSWSSARLRSNARFSVDSRDMREPHTQLICFFVFALQKERGLFV